MKRHIMVPVLVGARLLSGCLPGDTRPTPGHVFLTAEPSVATTEGVSTEDGWTIQFERLLAGLGNVVLVGDECNSYSGAHYDRLFDFTVPGAAKLGEAYGLGACDVRFSLSVPTRDALLGKGVSASDLDFMWAAAFMYNPPPKPLPGFGLPASVYARGVAKRGGETKHFDWGFSGIFFLNDCTSGPDATPTNAVHLSGGDDEHLELTFHGEELFRASAEDGAALRFDLLADADANSDGNITLEELGSVPAPAAEPDAGVEDAGAADGGVWGLPGLAGFLDKQLLPRMVHLDQGTCKAVAPRRDR